MLLELLKTGLLSKSAKEGWEEAEGAGAAADCELLNGSHGGGIDKLLKSANVSGVNMLLLLTVCNYTTKFCLIGPILQILQIELNLANFEYTSILIGINNN